ncbi:MAG: 4-hydroxy-tetrahydrodipicolinate reductase, partial [Arenimonas sp.]|nr:4-hydroxy-tetrahydrodipicolinate reductase [Arenimonas sp.]
MMSAPVRILIHGANGRMGQALIRLAQANPLLRVVSGTGRTDLARLDGVPEFDVALDFSAPEGFDAILALCIERKKALVSGTTGLSEPQFNALQTAGMLIPVLWASNFSLGVAVLSQLTAQAGRWLKHWNIDIIESHHIHKKDAPSGTALSLGQVAQGASGTEPNYHSLRCGDVVGEHTVQFSGIGERIELTHRASNRDIFA